MGRTTRRAHRTTEGLMPHEPEPDSESAQSESRDSSRERRSLDTRSSSMSPVRSSPRRSSSLAQQMSPTRSAFRVKDSTPSPTKSHSEVEPQSPPLPSTTEEFKEPTLQVKKGRKRLLPLKSSDLEDDSQKQIEVRRSSRNRQPTRFLSSELDFQTIQSAKIPRLKSRPMEQDKPSKLKKSSDNEQLSTMPGTIEELDTELNAAIEISTPEKVDRFKSVDEELKKTPESKKRRRKHLQSISSQDDQDDEEVVEDDDDDDDDLPTSPFSKPVAKKESQASKLDSKRPFPKLDRISHLKFSSFPPSKIAPKKEPIKKKEIVVIKETKRKPEKHSTSSSSQSVSRANGSATSKANGSATNKGNGSAPTRGRPSKKALEIKKQDEMSQALSSQIKELEDLHSQKIDISNIIGSDEDKDLDESFELKNIDDESEEEAQEYSFSIPDYEDEDEALMSRYSQLGKDEIELRIKEEDRNRISNSLKDVTEVCDLTFEQLRYIIKCELKDDLLKIYRGETPSDYDKLYRKSVQGNLELLSSIRDSMFSKKQAYYIHGCLNGLFLDKYMPAMENFGYIGKVLYPEALILMVVLIKQVDYGTARRLMANFLPPLRPEERTS